MASLVPNLRKTLYEARSIAGQLGFRPYQVAIVVGTWSGAYVGGNDKYEQVVPITEARGQAPKVRFLSEEALAMSASTGQGLNKGSCTVGPITPDFPGGGTALSELIPAVQARQTVHVRLTGPAYPNGALFAVKEVKTDRVLRWMLTCEPVEGGM